MAEILRRRGVEDDDISKLRGALALAPSDPMSADALAAAYAISTLTLAGTATPWRYTLRAARTGLDKGRLRRR